MADGLCARLQPLLMDESVWKYVLQKQTSVWSSSRDLTLKTARLRLGTARVLSRVFGASSSRQSFPWLEEFWKRSASIEPESWETPKSTLSQVLEVCRLIQQNASIRGLNISTFGEPAKCLIYRYMRDCVRPGMYQHFELSAPIIETILNDGFQRTSPIIAAYALGLLSQIMRDRQLCLAFRVDDVTQKSIEALKFFTENSNHMDPDSGLRLQRKLTRILFHTAHLARDNVELAKGCFAPFLPFLLSFITPTYKCKKILQDSLRIVSQLSYSEYPLERMMGENGIIKLLTQVLPTTSSELQEEVIRSLCNVTVDKLNATEFARLGGPTILLQLVNLPGRPDIFRAICLGTILNVLSNGVQVDLPREEVSVLLKTAGDSFRVQLTAIIIGCFLTPESPLLHSMIRQFCPTCRESFGYSFYPHLFQFLRNNTNASSGAQAYCAIMASWMISLGHLGFLSDPSWDSVLELLKKSRDVAIALEPSSFLMNQFDQALSVLTERPQQPSAV